MPILIAYGQIQDYSGLLYSTSNRYKLQTDSEHTISIGHGVFSILEMGVVEDTIYKSPYKIWSDTLILKNNSHTILLKIKSNGILQVLSDLSPYIKKGDKLYATVYYLKENVVLFGGDWKNDLKDGKWIFLDDSGKFSNIVFKDGVIIDIW